MWRMMIKAFVILIASTGAGNVHSADIDRLPNRRLIVLSDMHGICSTRYIPGVRRTVHQLDFVSYTVQLSSRTVAGSIRGSFGKVTPESTVGFKRQKITSHDGSWILATGRRGSELVLMREFVAGTTATIVVEKDVKGVAKEAFNMLKAMTACEVRQ